MSDEQSRRSATADSSADASESVDDADGDATDALEPSGGPRRVVSDQSVDDILDSLGETKANATDSSESTATREEGSTAVEFDENEVPAGDETATAAETESDGTEADADGTGTGTDDGRIDSTVEAGGASEGANVEVTGETSTDATDTDSGDGTDADGTAPVDSAASSLRAETARSDDEDASLEELAARIETGGVTGADVRAAEAGEGRESTPDVDEIELSMDDLEATRAQTKRAGTGNGGSDLGDDAGPLAGSIPRDDGSSDDDQNESETPGLFGRLKQLFSG